MLEREMLHLFFSLPDINKVHIQCILSFKLLSNYKYNVASAMLFL